MWVKVTLKKVLIKNRYRFGFYTIDTRFYIITSIGLDTSFLSHVCFFVHGTRSSAWSILIFPLSVVIHQIHGLCSTVTRHEFTLFSWLIYHCFKDWLLTSADWFFLCFIYCYKRSQTICSGGLYLLSLDWITFRYGFIIAYKSLFVNTVSLIFYILFVNF